MFKFGFRASKGQKLRQRLACTCKADQRTYTFVSCSEEDISETSATFNFSWLVRTGDAGVDVVFFPT